ncbi:MAG: CHAT domain-containing tetratricopeptide repeat protein [Gemmatimonadota bacterium]
MSRCSLNLLPASFLALLGLGAFVGCADPSGGEPNPGASTGGAAATSPTLTPAPASRLDSLLSQALDVYYAGAFDSARTILGSVARDAEAAGDTAARARALTWLGLAAWRQGRYAESRAVGEEALALKLEADLGDQLSRSYNALGLVAWQEARLGDAAGLFARAADVAGDIGDAAGAAKAAGNLGLVATELGEFAEARRGYTAMLEGGRVLSDTIMQAIALTNLGMLDIKIGQPRESIPQLQTALELYRLVDYATGQENALGQLGTAYAALGDLGRAHAMFDSALGIAREQGLRQEEANDLQELAGLYVAADNRGRALELHGAALDIYQEAGLQTEVAGSLRKQAEIYAELGNLSLGIQLATQALESHRRIGARFEEVHDLVVLTELHQLNGAHEASDRLLDEARALASELGARRARAAVALAEARIAETREDPGRVIAALSGAGPDLLRGEYSTEWEAQALRAHAFLRLGTIDSALVAGRRAVSTVERVRQSFRSQPMRAGFSRARRRTYAVYVSALLRAGRVAEAFQVADGARGRALREHLASRGSPAAAEAGRRGRGRGEDLLRQIDQLVSTVDAIQREARIEDGSAGASVVEDLWSRLSKARGEYEALQVSLTEETWRLERVPLAARSASEVRAALEASEVLIEYFVMPARVIAFVLTRDTLLLAESPLADVDLETRVGLARRLIAAPDKGSLESAPVLSALFEALIGPAARMFPILEAERLIIVPHDVLTYVPFAALQEPSEGRYLAEVVPIIQLSSAAALVELRSRRPRGPEIDLAVGEATVLVPFPRDLPASGAEARAVGHRRRDVRLYRGEKATEERLREALESGGLVHVASHAVMNARSPMFSRLELAPGRSGDARDDGRLEVHEVLGLSVKAALVYLSGCETGLGVAGATRFDRGEDYSTLSQAFLYAGARNVLATLWRVEDRSASLFARHFYEELQDVIPSEALSRAQRAMISHPEFGSPYYWAGYRLNGAGS